MVWVGLAAVLVLCFCVFRYAVPAMTNRYLAPAIDPQHRMAGTPSSRVLHVAAEVSPVAEKPAPLPFLMGLWLELREGVPVVHALLGGSLKAGIITNMKPSPGTPLVGQPAHQNQPKREVADWDSLLRQAVKRPTPGRLNSAGSVSPRPSPSQSSSSSTTA